MQHTDTEVLRLGLEERVFLDFASLRAEGVGSGLLAGLGSFGRLVIETETLAKCTTRRSLLPSAVYPEL